MADKLKLFIGESHRLMEIILWRYVEYDVLTKSWPRLLTDWSGFDLVKSSTHAGAYSLSIKLDPTANYIQGFCDHTTKLISLNVAEDWVGDVIDLWTTVRPESDKYANHQSQLVCKKNKTRGSARKGFGLQVEFVAYETALEAAAYELVSHTRPCPTFTPATPPS